MPKAQKSSATSATRKKHAKKSNLPPNVELSKEKKPKNKEKGKRKEPRQKMYIPPVKPAPIQPDPLETTGLGHSLPADLLVVLRSFNKKAQLTKIRALEELQTNWVERCRKENDEELVPTLVEMLPVWLHHIPALFLHPSRRIRSLAASLHTSLLQISSIREQIIFLMRESSSSSQLESILGTWCMSAHDADRSVSTTALRAWNIALSFSKDSSATNHLIIDDQILSALASFIQRAVLDPAGVYLYINPVPPTVPDPPARKVQGRSAPPLMQQKDESDQNLRSKSEEAEESEEDRRARLRISAIGAVRYVLGSPAGWSEGLSTFFLNRLLWSSLYHGEICPWINRESFGFGQPNVRKAAWSLVQGLSNFDKDKIKPLVPILSSAILRSAWVENDTTVHQVMWQPLLKFLKDWPEAWETERLQVQPSDEESDSEVEDDTDEPLEPLATPTISAAQNSSVPYQEFLQFLRSGCSGSPLQGYPTIVIILSTIPSPILASAQITYPLDDFFNAFWTATESRALLSLQRAATSAAFLSSLLECLIFLVRRILGNRSVSQNESLLGPDNNVDLVVKTLVTGQITRTWVELSEKKLKVEEQIAARQLAQTLQSLCDINEELFSVAWDKLYLLLKSTKATNAEMVSIFTKVFYDQFKDDSPPKAATISVLTELLNLSVEECGQSMRLKQNEGVDISIDSFEFLVSAIGQFQEDIFSLEDFAHRIDSLVSQDAYLLANVSPPLLLSYLLHRKAETKCLNVWHSLLSGLSRNLSNIQRTMTPVLDAARQGLLPNHLTPNSDELDTLIGNLLAKSLASSGMATDLSLVRQILVNPGPFLSSHGFDALLQSILSAFNVQFDLFIEGEEVELTTFNAPLDLVFAIFQSLSSGQPALGILNPLLPNIFLFGYLLPECDAAAGCTTFGTAQEIWKLWLNIASDHHKSGVLQAIKAQLRAYTSDTDVRIFPENILNMLSKNPPALQVNLISEIFPSIDDLNEMLRELATDAIDPSIGVMEPLIPPVSSDAEEVNLAPPNSTDNRGFAPYARVTSALLQVFGDDRQSLKRNLWALRHLIALSIYAQDFLSIPSKPSPIFAAVTLQSSLSDIVSQVKRLTAYTLTTTSNDHWHVAAMEKVVKGDKGDDLEPLSRFLVEVIRSSQAEDTSRDSRILRVVLEHVLDDLDKTRAEAWITHARKLEQSAPQTFMTIIASVTRSGAEPPLLDRYRNELAAAFLGIPARKANTEGLLTLRKLFACTPDSESDVAFLPQPRAVNLVKSCQSWVASDEDIDQAVESMMTGIFLHLAPILQNVRGAHWEFIFDLLESNLENSSINDERTYVTLYRSLQLVGAIIDLSSTNKTLRADWEARQQNILTMVRDIVAVRLDSLETSTPRSICREKVLAIAQDLPPSLIDHTSFPKMCHLITDSSYEVQKMAYKLLQSAAKKRTEHLVIEAGVDVEDTVKATLPDELLDMLQQNIHPIHLDEVEEDEKQNIFGYIIGWMLLFDLFSDASSKVKSNYIEQLRDTNIIGTHFMPTILTILRLDEGPGKAFKLDIWGIDRFFLEFYDPTPPHSTLVLTAHLYYRALLNVPALIQSWVNACKDRQLTTSITTYTAQYFSPLLIRSELAQVANTEGLADAAAGFSVRVSNTLSEVVASYAVDDHQLEVRVRVPSDWPLHKIEVRDLRRVGVDEARWRAWLMAVQQKIWVNNGQIAEGLSLFKKNVTLHFEGQVECAICYSIINITDGSLPRKPCKTCKNPFHAGCLYKWFSTSHSSSCPLCRADII